MTSGSLSTHQIQKVTLVPRTMVKTILMLDMLRMISRVSCTTLEERAMTQSPLQMRNLLETGSISQKATSNRSWMCTSARKRLAPMTQAKPEWLLKTSQAKAMQQMQPVCHHGAQQLWAVIAKQQRLGKVMEQRGSTGAKRRVGTVPRQLQSWANKEPIVATVVELVEAMNSLEICEASPGREPRTLQGVRHMCAPWKIVEHGSTLARRTDGAIV